MATLPLQRMSELIGLIYGCAIDPDRWPQTLSEICRTLACVSGGILLLDLEFGNHKFAYTYGLTDEWRRRYFDHSDDLTGFYRRAFSRDICLDGEPLLLSSLLPRIGPYARRVYD